MNKIKVDQVRCITIVHAQGMIKEYRELSSFFRFIGIFVCEKLFNDTDGDKTDLRIEIYDEKRPSLEHLLINSNLFSGFSLNILKEIYGDIYKKYKLMRGSYAVAYFYDCRDCYIYDQMFEAHGSFNNALNALSSLEKRVNINNSTSKNVLKYIWAAQCNCKRRMNELYNIILEALDKGWYNADLEKRNMMLKSLKNKKFFEYSNISKQTEEILKIDPGFYSAYAIRGFSAELDEHHRFDSISDFIRTITTAGEHSYLSYIYYRAGTNYETFMGMLDTKWELYTRAFELDSNNYRALYNLALKDQEDKNYVEAVSKFCKIIDILENKVIKIENGKNKYYSLQPIECAYLFKSYALVANLSIKEKKYMEAFSLLEKALEIYENTDNEDINNGFYPWMFDGKGVEYNNEIIPEWKIYKKAARNKLNVSNVYKNLADISVLFGDEEKYNKYYLLYLNQISN